MKQLRPFLRALGHQEYLRFGCRDRIIRKFHNPDAGSDERFEVDFFGMVYPGNFNTFVDWSVYYYGAYTKSELHLMRDFLQPMKDAVVVDVGANVGHHSLFAATVAAQVHSFEPFPKVSEQLKLKVRRNNLANVTVHEVALGNMEEERTYFPPLGNNTGTGTFVQQDGPDSGIRLRIVVGDSYFPEQGIDRIDFLKIDVEGFEVQVLEGMKETLGRTRPVCFLEWNQDSVGAGVQGGASLFPERYRFYAFEPHRNRLTFFSTGHYHLSEFRGAWHDCNVLAVPQEYVDRVKAMSPPPLAARRLG